MASTHPSKLQERNRHKDLIAAVDCLIDISMCTIMPLALFYMDLEKVFDMVPRNGVVMVLAEHYGQNRNIVETIVWMYTNMIGKVVGRH